MNGEEVFERDRKLLEDGKTRLSVRLISRESPIEIEEKEQQYKKEMEMCRKVYDRIEADTEELSRKYRPIIKRNSEIMRKKIDYLS